MRKIFCALAVGLTSFAGSAGAGAVTYEFLFTGLDWGPLGSTGTSENFFDLTGVNQTDSITVTVTFDPSLSYVFPENYSGSDAIYQENYTPWTSFDLSFGNEVYSALPTAGNPYTSIRVRDGISDGNIDISDRVLLDAEFTTLTPNGYEFTQALIGLFSYDETTFSGPFVPTPDVLNLLQDSNLPLSIPIAYQGTAVQRLWATQVSVSQILPGCIPSGGRPKKCDPQTSQIALNASIPLTPVPLPASLPLMLGGLLGLGWLGRKNMRVF